jgi:transcriptional regulator with XRE-family HTH domain
MSFTVFVTVVSPGPGLVSNWSTYYHKVIRRGVKVISPVGYRIPKTFGGGGVATPSWFAGRLRELRERAGLTQQQLADRAGVRREAVARWETARRLPDAGSIVRLRKALGVRYDELLGDGDDDRPVPEPMPRGRPKKAPPAEPPPPKRPRGRARKEK